MPDWKREIKRLQLEPDIAEELAQHLTDRYEELLLTGVTPENAHSTMLAELNDEHELPTPELRRIQHGKTSNPLAELWQDLRYGLRMLRKSPVFTAITVLLLALGIGANSAIFSVIDALILKRLPVRNPEQLVTFKLVSPDGGTQPAFVYRYFEGIRNLKDAFSGAYAVCRQDRYNVMFNGEGGVDAGQVRASLVTGNYFTELGVNAIAGRTLTEEDDVAPGGHPLAVISHRYAEQKFGRAADAVGRTFTLNGTTYTIIGVTPRGFSGEWVGRPVDMWFPLAMLYQVMPELPPGQRGGGDGLRIGMNFRIIARLKPGVTTTQAQAAGQVIFQQLLTEAAGPVLTPEQVKQIAQTRLEIESAATGYSMQRDSFARPLAILMIVVGAVLLIACANVANLLLARSAARQREMAVRLALGASRSRIVRQLLTESMMLAIMGGALGLLVAWWGTSVLATWVASGPMVNAALAIDLDLRPNGRIVAFTTSLCVLTGILFGLAPAFQSLKVSLVPALSGRSATSGGGAVRSGLRQSLVIGQVALSLVLLIGTGLFVRTLRNLKAQDLGFERDHVLLVWTNPGQTGRDTRAMADLFGIVQERISALPGVRSASPSVYGFLRGGPPGGPPITTEGGQPSRAQMQIVGPGFFETIGQRLLLGRDFTVHDTETAPLVVVVNESLARHFFGSDNPVGKRIKVAVGNSPWLEIVGVVKDTKQNTPRDEDRLMFYYPVFQQIVLHRLMQMCLAVRAYGSPIAIAAGVRQELRNIDPNLPILDVNTVEEQLDDVLVQERLIAKLATFFGGLAVLLACLGLYGVISYSVARRTNEMGIRLALGATSGCVLRMVLRESLWLVLIGVAIGVSATLVSTRFVSSLLFGVSATDPLTVAGATLLLVFVAAVASFLPALRASRVDPMVALRCE